MLVKSIETNKYYWIRGIRWNSVHQKEVFQFGDEYPKTYLDKTIKYALDGHFKYPIIAPKSGLLIDGTFVNTPDIITILMNYSFDEMVSLQQHIIELVIQLSILLPLDKFNDFKRSCLRTIKEKQETNIKSDKQELLKLHNLVKKKFRYHNS